MNIILILCGAMHQDGLAGMVATQGRPSESQAIILVAIDSAHVSCHSPLVGASFLLVTDTQIRRHNELHRTKPQVTENSSGFFFNLY